MNYQLRKLAREIARRILTEFDSSEKRKEFEEWYFNKYGVPYQWKKKGITHGENIH